MRISDWSSDVCSSDLPMIHAATATGCAGFALSVLALQWQCRNRKQRRRTLQQKVHMHGSEHTVTIVYCTNDDEDAIAQLCEQARKERVVGLDCEWRPETKGTQSKTAVVQLAAGDFVYIQRILHKEVLHPTQQALFAAASM